MLAASAALSCARPAEPAARHGGELAKAPFGYAELVIPEPGRFAVYLSDAAGRPLSPASTSGRLSVSLPNYADVALWAQGDHLEGRGAALPQATPGAVLALTRSGEIHLVRFPGRQPRAPSGGERGAPGPDELAVRVTDSDCARREGVEGEHRECAIRCLHQGAELVLVDRDSDRVYRAVGPGGTPVQERLLPFVGYDVLVRGRAGGEGEQRTFEVDEVRPAHDHTPLFGGAVGMAGDLHLEALALRSGEVRIYLSDRFRRSVSAEGQAGRIELRAGSAAARSAALSTMPGGRGLVAQVGALPPGAVELTAHLVLRGIAERYAVPVDAQGGFFMTFMVEPQDGAEPPTRAPPGGARAPDSR